MATTSGAVGTFNRTVGVKIDMDDAIYILPVDDVPLQRFLPSETTTSVKVEWMNEALTGQTDTLSGVAGTGPWTANVVDGAIFRVNDIVHVQDAASGVQFVITAISTNQLTLTAFAGNVTAPVNTNVVEIVGQYLVEGSDPVAARTQERTGLFNYAQIGQEKVEATRTQRKRAMYGNDADPYDHEVSKKFRELAIRFERALVHGQRSISGGSDQRAMGGLFFYLSTNTASNTVANTKTAINSLIRQCWAKGGTPTTLMCSPAIKAAISANVDPSARRFDTSNTIGGYVVDKYLSDFGEIEIVPNRYFPLTKGILLQREFTRKKVFDAYYHELLAKTGDADKGEIVGEFSLEVKNESAMGVLTLTDAT